MDGLSEPFGHLSANGIEEVHIVDAGVAVVGEFVVDGSQLLQGQEDADLVQEEVEVVQAQVALAFRVVVVHAFVDPREVL